MTNNKTRSPKEIDDELSALEDVVRKAPSRGQLSSVAVVIAAILGGGQYLSTKEVGEAAAAYTDAAEERSKTALSAAERRLAVQLAADEARTLTMLQDAERRTRDLVAAHASLPNHGGAVAKETFEEFRRTLESALEQLATKSDVRSLETSTNLLREEVRRLEKRVEEIGDG